MLAARLMLADGATAHTGRHPTDIKRVAMQITCCVDPHSGEYRPSVVT